jgi:3-mercaptopyruvate sulfurtransferase SseA
LDDPVVTTNWLAQHLNEVTVLDVRGHVDTEVVEPGVEKSTYMADYDAYLEGHIPVSALNSKSFTLCF